jgi:hypothetical protein
LSVIETTFVAGAGGALPGWVPRASSRLSVGSGALSFTILSVISLNRSPTPNGRGFGEVTE